MPEMRSVLRLIFRYIKELFYRLGFWKPAISDDEKAAVNRFVNVNSCFWNEETTTKDWVLLEGHLSQYGPNYAFRTGLVGRAIQEQTGHNVEVVFNGLSHQWPVAKQLYASFKIFGAVYLGSFPIRNFIHMISALFFSGFTVSRLRSSSEILDIEFDEIKVGDLIYDDLIKLGPEKTLDQIDFRVFMAIARSRYYFLQYRFLFRRRKYDYYVSTHTQYSEYGLLCRVALGMGVKVLETTDIHMSYFESIAKDRLPTYHEGVGGRIREAFAVQTEAMDSLRDRAQQSLAERMGAKLDQIDAKRAYVGTVYDKQSLAKKLNVDPNLPMVFIAAHVCADAPHASSMMLHADYYQWLTATVEVASKNAGVTWIVKPHPSCSIYGEEGLVEEVVDKYHMDHIHICPSDLNVKSIGSCASAVVTVYGTVGLEYSCLGVPAVLAGRSFYAGFGFTTDPQTLAQYEQILLNIGEIPDLTHEQISKALEVYALWNDQFDWTNPIVSSDVLACIWGSGRERDLVCAFELMSSNLENSDPRSLKLWKYSQASVLKTA